MNLTIPRRTICAFLLSVASLAVCADEPAQASVGTRLVLSQTELILRVAKQFPCTAVAIMQALGAQPAAEGTVVLDEIPTSETISRMIRALPNAADVRATLMSLRNPYSSQAFFIDAEWAASLAPDKTIVLTFRTQWVARDGAELSPRHLIEPEATLLITDEQIRFTTRSGAPPITASLTADGR